MLSTTRKNLLIFLGAIVVSVLLYDFVYWSNSPSGRQYHSLRLARDQANKLREKFGHDATFQYVQFIGTFKREDQSPCLMVSGAVLTREDFYAVTNAVESLGCPLEIFYQLTTSDQYFEWSDRGGRPIVLRETHRP